MSCRLLPLSHSSTLTFPLSLEEVAKLSVDVAFACAFSTARVFFPLCLPGGLSSAWPLGGEGRAHPLPCHPLLYKDLSPLVSALRSLCCSYHCRKLPSILFIFCLCTKAPTLLVSFCRTTPPAPHSHQFLLPLDKTSQPDSLSQLLSQTPHSPAPSVSLDGILLGYAVFNLFHFSVVTTFSSASLPIILSLFFVCSQISLATHFKIIS